MQNVIFDYDSTDKEHIMIVRFSEPEKFMNQGTFIALPVSIYQFRLKIEMLTPYCLSPLSPSLFYLNDFGWIDSNHSSFLYSISIHTLEAESFTFTQK